jgi:hypothetical protein
VYIACQILGIVVLILGFIIGVWTSIIYIEVYIVLLLYSLIDYFINL